MIRKVFLGVVCLGVLVFVSINFIGKYLFFWPESDEDFHPKWNAADINSWFDDNYDFLLKTTQVCEKYPAFRRIEDSKESKKNSQYKVSLELEESQIYDQLVQEIGERKIGLVKCYRDENKIDGYLKIVSFTLFASGFLGDGWLISVQYYPELDMETRAYFTRRGNQHLELSRPDWYLWIVYPDLN